MEIKLYDNNLSSPTFQEDLTDKIQGLQFSTKLPGGFELCSFTLKADLPEAWEWLTKKVFYRLVISDGEKILWEGRIQDLELLAGHAGATAYGYWASLNDGKYKTAYNANADAVIKAILTAQCPSISSDQSHIDATGGPAISSAAGTKYLDQSPRILVEMLAAFGDTAGNQWYFAIWEDRTAYFFKRDASSIDWLVTLGDLAKFKLKHRAGDLWNKAYALYTSGGTLTRTADAENTLSQSKYNLMRYYCIPNLGEVAAAAAQAARDTWLAEHKDIWPSLEEFVLGDTVYDTNKVPYPSSWVRAGDVIRVLDLVPGSAELDAVVRDALRTFYILGTEYELETGQNRLVVDTESKDLDAILARSL